MVRRSTRKYNRYSGGGWGFTGQTIPGVSNYGQVNTPIGDCRAQQPPGYISSYSSKGLPGLSGGAYNENQVNGTGALANTSEDEELVANQSGGRYSFDLAKGRGAERNENWMPCLGRGYSTVLQGSFGHN